MPRGSSRLFRTRMDGAAEQLGISGGVANRLTDKTFRNTAAGAYEEAGFGVNGPKVSRIFQANADLAISELGLAAFTAQTMSIDFDGSTEFFRNSTPQVIGIADVWSIGIWYKPSALSGLDSLFEFNNSDTPSRIIAFFNAAVLNVFLRNSADTITSSVTFNGFGVNAAWAYLYLSWNAAGNGFPTIFKDGSSVPPSGSSSGGVLVQADDLRPVGVGTNLSLAAKFQGVIAQMAVWRTIQDAAISDLFNGGNPNSLDLNSSFGGYSGAGDLAHWYRLGHEPSPNLGKDFATAGFTPTIDIEVNSVGITDADRVADVPT